MVELFDKWIHAFGSFGTVILGLSAMLEYVFPPFPGDSILLLGGVYAARGSHPWPLVLLAVTSGSVAGAAINYWVGFVIAGRMARHPDRRTHFGISTEAIVRAQQRMRERGSVVVLFNRFIPGVRAVLFIAAGAALMPLKRVLFLGTLSALAWNSIVLGAGFALGGNLERLTYWMKTYQTGVIVLVLLVATALVVRFAVRTREARS